MKKVILLSLVALLSSGLMFAQNKAKTNGKQPIKTEQSQKGGKEACNQNHESCKRDNTNSEPQTTNCHKEQFQQRALKTPTERAAEMQKEYNLTSQQTKDLIAFYEKQDKQRAEMRSDVNQKREDIQKQREANQQELKKILGEDNYNKMIAKRQAERRGEMNKNRNGRNQNRK